MPTLRQVFYVSRLAEGMVERDVRNILAISRRNNRMLDVTGCLTCTGRHFAQVLEGREAAVAGLMLRIAVDLRHSDFRIVVDRPLSLRQHPLWSMAYLYNSELADDVEAMFDAEPPVARQLLHLMGRLKPDTVMGAL
jgi:hypothetical protein